MRLSQQQASEERENATERTVGSVEILASSAKAGETKLRLQKRIQSRIDCLSKDKAGTSGGWWIGCADQATCHLRVQQQSWWCDQDSRRWIHDVDVGAGTVVVVVVVVVVVFAAAALDSRQLTCLCARTRSWVAHEDAAAHRQRRDSESVD